MVKKMIKKKLCWKEMLLDLDTNFLSCLKRQIILVLSQSQYSVV